MTPGLGPPSGVHRVVTNLRISGEEILCFLQGCFLLNYQQDFDLNNCE